MAERHAPAFVVVDEDYTVLHFSGPMGRYMAPATGAASLDLLALVHPALRAELRAALVRAGQAGKAVELGGVNLGAAGDHLRTDVIVEPRAGRMGAPPGFVVIFKESGARLAAARNGGDEGAASDDELRRLGEELGLTRDRLQATIEELESTNEELKSSNEEYQSLNEELQSANEELETSREELQSVNEELTTVNGELAHRVQELGRANSDLKNFLESTQIATLFLDNELRVTNFTPAIADIFHLVESDQGRPIGHFKARVAYEELAEDARRVLRSLTPAEREIGNPQTGAHYIARVLPYRSTDNFIAGVVVTFVDVTARRQAEAALRASEARYRHLFEAMEEGYAVADVVFDDGGRAIDLHYIEANPASRHLTGHDLTGRRLSTIDPHFEAYWYEASGRVARTGTSERLELHAAPLDRWYNLILFKLHPEDEGSDRVAALFQDVTARRAAEEALRQSEARFRALASAGAISSYRMSPDWRLMHQLDSRDFLASTVDPSDDWRDRYILPEDRARLDAAIEEAIRTRSIFELEHRVMLADGSVGWVSSRAIPMLDDDGEITEWFGTGSDITARKRAEEALRESDRRQAFLLRLSDALRPLSDPEAVTATACRILARHLGVSRAQCTEIEGIPGSETGTIRGEYARDGHSMPRRYSNAQYGEAMLAPLRAGETLVLTDIPRDPRTTEDTRRAFAAVGTLAGVSVPLVKKGRLTAAFTVHSFEARNWTPAEIALVEEVAERTWAVFERAQAEAALRESEERFRQFADASQDLLWVRDAETMQWEYLSPAFAEIYGVPRDEALGGDTVANWLDMIHPEDRAHAHASLEKVRAGEQVTFEYRIRRPADGQIRWLRNTDFPMRDEAGRITHIGGVGHDATELKAAEAALAAAERRQRALIEGIPQLVWRAVDGGEWTWASPQWCDHTGQSLEDSLGHGWLAALHPDDRKAALQFWARAEKAGRLEMEVRIRCAASAVYRWFQTRATAVRDTNGVIVEWLGTSTDIDEMRSLQERQMVLVAELQHRTRNLLAVVGALMDTTLRNHPDTDSFVPVFRHRLDALARVNKLLSRLHGGDRVTFDELIRTELSALGAVDHEGRGEQVTLDGPDAVRLQSSTVQTFALALHELATNALKYGALSQSGGHLAVHWRRVRGKDGPRLRVEWTETGVAMPAPGADPQNGGYGRLLIEHALPYQLGAETDYEVGPDGVRCTVTSPLSSTEGRLDA